MYNETKLERIVEVTWNYTRTLLGEETQLKFMMSFDNGWLPAFSKIKNNLGWIAEQLPQFQAWAEEMNTLYSRQDGVSWEYFRKNDRLIALKYDLEKIVKDVRRKQAKNQGQNDRNA